MGFGAMKQMTLGEAAKATGKSKSTIFRAVKSGKLSATREGEEYRIDPAELFRAFPRDVPDAVQRNDTQPHSAMPEVVGETAKDVEIRMLREMLQVKDQQIETLQQSLRLIERVVPDQSAPAPQARSLWARIIGR